MKWHAVGPLVAKDLTLFFRNRFFAFITVLGLVAYVGIYLAMPSNVDETIALGVYTPSGADWLSEFLGDEGVDLWMPDSEEALQQAVLDREITAGIALPEAMLEQMRAGLRPTVRIYLTSDAPEETREMMVVLVEALALELSGSPLGLVTNDVTLGTDMAGNQIAPRDRMLPLLAVVVLMMETLGLASLIAEEAETGTLRAILVTPLGIRELFLGKGLTSVSMTFAQVALFMLLVGGLAHQPLIMLIALLLGALMVTGIGFLMASAARDMMTVIGVGMLAIVLLSVPPFGVMFPGTVTVWARAIPSHYLANAIHQVVNLGAGWSQVWQNLVILLGMNVVLFWLGVVALKRKLA